MKGAIHYEVIVNDKESFNTMASTKNPIEVSVIINTAKGLLQQIENPQQKHHDAIKVLDEVLAFMFKATMAELTKIN